MHKLPVTQQGSALIVVVLFLILIMMGGVVAVRQARLDMQVATADQARVVLLQSADSAQNDLEMTLNANSNKQSANYKRLVENPYGPIGYFLAATLNHNESNLRNIYKFCYTPDTNYAPSQGTIEVPEGGVIMGKNGYCKQNSLIKYASKRDISTVQVSVRNQKVLGEGQNLSHIAIGKEVSRSLNTQLRIDAQAELPSYGNTAPHTTVTQIVAIRDKSDCHQYIDATTVGVCTAH